MSESSLRTILLVILGVVFVFGTLALVMVSTYRRTVKNHGRGSAGLIIRLRESPMALALLTCLVFNALPDNAIRQAAVIVLSLIFGLFGGRSFIRALRSHETPPAILELNTVQATSTTAIAVLGLAALGLFLFALYSSEFRATALAFSSLCLLVAGDGAISQHSKTLLTEDGLYIHLSLIKWERMKRFVWMDQQKGIILLIVQVAGRLLPFDLECLPIPADKQEAVNQLLISHVPAKAVEAH